MDIYEKSHKILKEIIKSQDKFNFKIILIGGWGVYCYNPYMKSKDIDFLIREQDFWKLRNFLNSLGFRETGKVLEKIGFALLVGDDKIEIDVYDKKIGNVNVKEIFDKNLFSLKEFDGLKVCVANLELLLALKVISGFERIGTGKGMKDISDILAILDKHSQKINFDIVYSYVDRTKVKKVFSVIFSDYKKIKNLYPIGFTKFEKIKKSLKL
jgi:hypothetical protein